MKVVFARPSAMTQMSEPHAVFRRARTANPPSRHAGSPLARALHTLVATGFFAMSVGCIIPPSLSVDVQDAGVDSPPAILSVRSDNQELPEPGPVLFEVGNPMQTLNLQLLDTDLSDTLYVHIFVDYTVAVPTPARSTCTGATNTTAQRTATCDLRALCTPADVGQTRLMRIVVFDRDVLDVGAGIGPPFMNTQNGQSTSRTYQLKCTS
jgi:hypothetical protein